MPWRIASVRSVIPRPCRLVVEGGGIGDHLIERPGPVMVCTVRWRCPTHSPAAVANPYSTNFFGSAYKSRSDWGQAKRRLRVACCVSS